MRHVTGHSLVKGWSETASHFPWEENQVRFESAKSGVWLNYLDHSASMYTTDNNRL